MSRRQHRVLLVREWDEQLSGSGCCGRLGSEVTSVIDGDGEDPYACVRGDMERVGEVYRALRDRFDEDELEVTVVDPRNTVALLPAIWRDARRRGMSVTATLRQLNAATAACAVVVDGKVLTKVVDPARAVAEVEADLLARA
ncbi:MAG: hypothetical protein GEV07_14195 [Streptosporangiales bacterium]|nr:hypothetical protein [Streptosporangiales bacterium]